MTEKKARPTKRIAIVIPVYREERDIERLHGRLDGVIAAIPTYAWDCLFVIPLNSVALRARTCRRIARYRLRRHTSRSAPR